MRRLVVLCLSLGACAAEKPAERKAPNDAKPEATARTPEQQGRDAAQKLKEATNRAVADCAALGQRALPPGEVQAVGLAMAVGVARNGPGLYVDGNLERVPENVKPGPLPKGPKNDLNVYVQRVGNRVVASLPKREWTFAVLDSPEAISASNLGGYVFISTAVFAQLDNEAELAGVLAHEIAHVAADHHQRAFVTAQVAACRVALTGLYLVERGMADVPGAEEFVQQARFGRTMKRLAAADAFELTNDPSVDSDFMAWFINRVLDVTRLMGLPREDELAADTTAVELLSKAGYDASAMLKVAQAVAMPMTPRLDMRVAAIEKALAVNVRGGVSPRFPAEVKMPPPLPR